MGRHATADSKTGRSQYLVANPEPDTVERLALKVHKWDPDCRRHVWGTILEQKLDRRLGLEAGPDARSRRGADRGDDARDGKGDGLMAATTSGWDAVRAGARKLRDGARRLPDALRQRFFGPSPAQKDDPGAAPPRPLPWLKPGRGPVLRPPR